MKKFVSALLVCLVLLSAVAAPAQAGVFTLRCGNDATWSLDESTGTLTIRGTGPMYRFQSWRDDNPMATPPWWDWRLRVKKVVVEEGVTSVGENAFADNALDGEDFLYANLTEVVLADSVTSIGEGAFMGCPALKTVHLGAGLRTIGDFAFFSDQQLKEITFPDSLTSIGAGAFAITGMTQVTIPPSVTSIGQTALGCNFHAEGGAVASMNFTIIGQKGTEAEAYYKRLLREYNDQKAMFGAYYSDNYAPGGTVWFVAAPEPVAGFSDVTWNDWFAEDVIYAVDKGLMSGTDARHFSPSSTMTRAMVVTVLYRLAGSPAVSGSSFSDVKASDWYGPAVQWSSQNSIVTGYADGRFGPNDPLTREQFAVMLYRYAQYEHYDTARSGDLSPYSDGWTVSEYAREAMTWAVGKGLITGMGDSTLLPGGSTTRAQATAILHRFDEKIVALGVV